MAFSSAIVVFAACMLTKRYTHPETDFAIGYIEGSKQKDYEQLHAHSPNETVYS